MARFGRMIPIIILLCFLFGCGKGEQTEENGYYIYYLNKDVTKITGLPYEMTAQEDDTKGMIDELIEKMQQESDDVEYKECISQGIKVEGYMLEGSLLSLYFNEKYHTLDKVQETLSRAAIVRTMMQVPGVECLSFYVGENPLLDGNGNPVGVMNNESFVENPGEQINSIQVSTIILYFSNQDGNGLVQETQEVHYSSNISMEKLIMEHLLEGPNSENAQAAIPDGTKLVSVSVLDGVCYVNLDDAFMNQNYNIEEPIVIYSIVNSLTQMATVNKVQISVNGNTKGVYRDSFELGELYERNLDYVKEINDTEMEINDMEEEVKQEISE